MAILPNFLPSMGYQYFLSYGVPRARSSAKTISRTPGNFLTIIFHDDRPIDKLERIGARGEPIATP